MWIFYLILSICDLQPAKTMLMDFLCSCIVSQVKKTWRQDRSLFYGQYYGVTVVLPIGLGASVGALQV